MKMDFAELVMPVQVQHQPASWYYKNARQYLQVIEAFAQTMHQCVYIIDHHNRDFLYVSDNPLLLCGKSPQEVKKSGYKFYFSHVPPDEVALLSEVNQAGLDFYNNTLISERLKYTISYDFHLLQPGNRRVLVNHKLTPLVLDDQHNMWLSLCVVTHSSNRKPGNFIITKRGEKQKDSLHYNFTSKEWVKQKRIRLTQRQTEILALSAQGLTVNEIATELDISSDTVKLHKKNIFDKLQVKNMVEAVRFAANHNLFE